jgi:hypothetical protein
MIELTIEDEFCKAEDALMIIREKCREIDHEEANRLGRLTRETMNIKLSRYAFRAIDNQFVAHCTRAIKFDSGTKDLVTERGESKLNFMKLYGRNIIMEIPTERSAI